MANKVLDSVSNGQLEGVAGGYIFDSSVLTHYPNVDNTPWEVLDDKGNVVTRRSDGEYAWNYALKHGYSTEILTWEQVQKLRETGSPY